jgi:hypothetical protein
MYGTKLPYGLNSSASWRIESLPHRKTINVSPLGGTFLFMIFKHEWLKSVPQKATTRYGSGGISINTGEPRLFRKYFCSIQHNLFNCTCELQIAKQYLVVAYQLRSGLVMALPAFYNIKPR